MCAKATDLIKANVNGRKHSDIEEIIESVRKKDVTYDVMKEFLDRLKPYIDDGMCKVRFIDFSMSPDKISMIIDDEARAGWCGITMYKFLRHKQLRKGIFTNTAMLLIFKRTEDVREMELLKGLDNSACIKIN